METLSLPMIKVEDSLRDVIKLMRATSRSGAVFREGNKYWLVKAPDVVIHIRMDPEATISSLPHAPIREIDVARVARKTPGPTLHLRSLADELTQSETGLGVLVESEKQVVVATVSEALHTLLFSGPRDCYCSKTGDPVPGGTDGAPCPERDGGTVCCG